MRSLIFVLFMLVGFVGKSQGFDFQSLCLACAEQQGFYCGDDPANWTQYAPDGCVQTDWINDGWEDCVDAADENAEGPTLPTDCLPPIPVGCDTVFVDIPFYIYETIIQVDTIYDTEYITQIIVDTFQIETFVPEYIYITDTVTVYEDVLDTLVVEVPVIEYVDTVIYETITETEYVEIFVVDTVIDYIEIIQTEYIDCETGMPCNFNIPEILEKSENDGRMYNILGQPIRRPESIYIHDGKIKYMQN
tara:strand:- start:698 stop:1441 length:744 start_codon:yes stop_codon:yes gene_type:complete